MSRSYKKTPIIKDNRGGRKVAKRTANKKVRNAKRVSNGKQYRKYFNTYDIYDYVYYESLTNRLKYWDAENEWLKKYYPTKEDFIHHWRKYYYMK